MDHPSRVGGGSRRAARAYHAPAGLRKGCAARAGRHLGALAPAWVSGTLIWSSVVESLMAAMRTTRTVIFIIVGAAFPPNLMIGH